MFAWKEKFGKLKLLSKFAVGGVLLLLILHIVQFDKRKFNVDPYPIKITKNANLYSYHGYSGKQDRFSKGIATVKSGTNAKAMEVHSDWVKVLLPDDTMGWILEENIALSKNSLTKNPEDYNSGIYDVPNVREGEELEHFKKRTYVKILELKEQKSARSGYDDSYTKIETPKGNVGWISNYYLERVGWEKPRSVKRKDWRYKGKHFKKKWQNKKIKKFEKKFSEPFAIQQTGEAEIYYYNNISLFTGNRQEFALQVHVVDEKISKIMYGTRIKKWIGYFPLSSTLRSSFLLNTLWNYFDVNSHASYDKYGDEVSEVFLDRFKIFVIVFVIISLVLVVSLYYFILRLPFMIIDKYAWKKSYNLKIKNSSINFFVTLNSLLFGYLWFVFLNVNISTLNNWFLVHFLFALGMTSGFINNWKTNLAYHRCQKCHNWSGKHDRTEDLGGIIHTETLKHGNGNKEQRKGTERKYRDFQYCDIDACGYTWYIDRTTWSGWSGWKQKW